MPAPSPPGATSTPTQHLRASPTRIALQPPPYLNNRPQTPDRQSPSTLSLAALLIAHPHTEFTPYSASLTPESARPARPPHHGSPQSPASRPRPSLSPKHSSIRRWPPSARNPTCP